MKNNMKKWILSALFAALTCAATMSVRIPTPGTGGYIHPGDAIVILSGIVLGPVFGFLAGGIGSAMSDLLGGYLTYVPITFLIKGLVALFAGLSYRRILSRSASPKRLTFAIASGGILDIILVTGGYFFFEFLLYGAGAAASIPANLIQGLSGLILSLLLYPLLASVPDVKKLLAAHH